MIGSLVRLLTTFPTRPLTGAQTAALTKEVKEVKDSKVDKETDGSAFRTAATGVVASLALIFHARALPLSLYWSSLLLPLLPLLSQSRLFSLPSLDSVYSRLLALYSRDSLALAVWTLA
ncbi:MAG: hypothetical protein SGCHY_003566, partial [Lobulomycetales sp.]